MLLSGPKLSFILVKMFRVFSFWCTLVSPPFQGLGVPLQKLFKGAVKNGRDGNIKFFYEDNATWCSDCDCLSVIRRTSFQHIRLQVAIQQPTAASDWDHLISCVYQKPRLMTIWWSSVIDHFTQTLMIWVCPAQTHRGPKSWKLS